MRILAFIILSCTLIMCKSKNAIPNAQLLNYVVLLQGEKTPKAIKKSISADLVEFNKTDKSVKAANLWTVSFKDDVKNGKELMVELLNHPDIVSALTLDEYEKIQLKKVQPTTKTTQSKKKVTKH